VGNHIPVLGPDGTILSYTNPARARQLATSGKAVVVQERPFIIRLKRDPTKEGKMTDQVTNFTEFFRNERDIYVQNKSNTQVSMQFETHPGRIESVLLPRDKKPINLTNLVPFDALKQSVDLRKMITRRPPVLVFLEENDYIKYYEDLAAAKKSTADAEIESAHTYQRDLQDRRVFTNPTLTAAERKTLDEEAQARAEEPADPDEKIQPRIYGMCTSAGDDVAEKDRLGAREMLEELKDMVLTTGDLEFLLGHVKYKSVLAFVHKELEARHVG
jgi:hypothetical protein